MCKETLNVCMYIGMNVCMYVCMRAGEINIYCLRKQQTPFHSILSGPLTNTFLSPTNSHRNANA